MRISDWSSDVCSSDLVRFPARQIDSAFPAARRSRRRVKLEVAGFQNRLPARAGAAEECANTRGQFVYLHRLDDIIVGAGVKPCDPVPERPTCELVRASSRARVCQYV